MYHISRFGMGYALAQTRHNHHRGDGYDDLAHAHRPDTSKPNSTIPYRPEPKNAFCAEQFTYDFILEGNV